MNNPKLTDILFKKQPPQNYLDGKDTLFFQLLAYNQTDTTPQPVPDYSLENITVNGDLFQPQEEKSYPPRKTTDFWLQLFGRTQEGYSVCVHVDYWPCLLVCLPDTWTEVQTEQLMSYFFKKRKLGRGIVSWKVKRFHRLCGFFPDLNASTPQLAKFPFLQIWCKSKSYVHFTKNFFKYSKISVCNVKNHTFQVIEEDIPPVLQFLESCGAIPSGGIEVDIAKLCTIPQGQITHCDLEYACVVRQFVGQNPFKGVNIDEICPIILCSFDIECCPTEGNRFPDAKVDPCICICSTVCNMKTGQMIRASHSLGHHSPIKTDTEVHQFKYTNEQTMMEEWRDFIIYIDPDITMGYNTHWFDWPYLNTRMDQFMSSSRFFYMSRMIRFRSSVTEKEFTSKAHGSSVSKKFMLPGRIDMDLYTYMKRNYKLKSYKLGRVAMHFLKMDKIDLEIPVMNANFRSNDPDRLATNVEYCIRDTELPISLWKHQHILETIIEMSRVTCVFMQDIFSRGQMFKVVSQMYIKGRKLNFALTTMPNSKDTKGYKGATVLNMKSGYYEMVVVLDFASLYPSIMKAKNLCYTSLVTDDVKYGNLEHLGYTYHECVIEKKTNKFQQSVKGLLPQIIDELLVSRYNTKKLMKGAKQRGETGLAAILNARQLALKISCNSIYGFTGASMSKYWCPQIASTVTAYGRFLIDSTKIIIEQNFLTLGAEVIYGDTDSVMVIFNNIKPDTAGFKQAFEVGHDAAQIVSNSFHSAIVLEMEKVYYPMLADVKKRYTGLAFEDPTDKGKMDAKGVALVRRDFCDYHQHAYKEVLHALLYNKNMEKGIEIVETHLRKLIEKNVPFDQLVLSRKLAKEYKSLRIAQKIVADKIEQRLPGSGPRSGDRVDFVVVNTKHIGPEAPLYKKVEDTTFAKTNNLQLDLVYYVRSFKPCMLTLFKPYNVTRRLERIFHSYAEQGRRIISGNSRISDFYDADPVIENPVAKRRKKSMFTRRKSVKNTQRKISFFTVDKIN
jgi:DNA polymerase delta subunit 1